jgi:hypothetical protein
MGGEVRLTGMATERAAIPVTFIRCFTPYLLGDISDVPNKRSPMTSVNAW